MVRPRGIEYPSAGYHKMNRAGKSKEILYEVGVGEAFVELLKSLGKRHSCYCAVSALVPVARVN
jgi:hypothetical protein